jgi:hypothetical protein
MVEKSVAAIFVFLAPSDEMATEFQKDFGERVSTTIDTLLRDWPAVRPVKGDRGRRVIAALVRDIPGIDCFDTRDALSED